MDGLPSGYGVSLLQTLVALVAVSALAWVVLRWLARTGLGQGGAVLRGGGNARIEVVERRLLDRHRVLWVVRVDGRGFLLGAGESGAPVVLAELAPDGDGAAAGLEPRPDVRDARDADPAGGAPSADATSETGPARSFGDALSRVAGGGAGRRRG